MTGTDSETLHFHVCIVGTGLTECVVAASLVAAGLHVLHIDALPFYGRCYGSLSLKALCNCVTGSEKSTGLEAQEQYIYSQVFSRPYLKWNPFCSPEDTPSEPIETLPSSAMSGTYIDLHPRLMYAQGPLASFLITSGVAQYIDLCNVDTSHVLVESSAAEICTERDAKRAGLCSLASRFPLPLDFEPSFGSKSNIFKNKKLTPFEKRLVMKLFTSTFTLGDHPSIVSPNIILPVSTNFVSPALRYYHEFASHDSNNEASWDSILNNLNIQGSLANRVTYGFLLKTYTDAFALTHNGLQPWTFSDASQRFKLITSSMGRYSESAYLFPMYGSGDIPQALSRYCAVRKGVHMLSTFVHAVQVVVMNPDKAPQRKTSALAASPTLSSPCVSKGEDSPSNHESTSKEGVTTRSPVNSASKAEKHKETTSQNALLDAPDITLLLSNSIRVKTKALIVTTNDINMRITLGDQIHGAQQETLLSLFSDESQPQGCAKSILRLVAVLDQAVLPRRSPTCGANFCVVITKSHEPVHILELSTDSGCTPSGYTVLHMTQMMRLPSPSTNLQDTQSVLHDCPPEFCDLVALLKQLVDNASSCKCKFVSCWTINQSPSLHWTSKYHPFLFCLPDVSCDTMSLYSTEDVAGGSVVDSILTAFGRKNVTLSEVFRESDTLSNVDDQSERADPLDTIKTFIDNVYSLNSELSKST